jgi:hypothetical protein
MLPLWPTHGIKGNKNLISMTLAIDFDYSKGVTGFPNHWSSLSGNAEKSMGLFSTSPISAGEGQSVLSLPAK